VLAEDVGEHYCHYLTAEEYRWEKGQMSDSDDAPPGQAHAADDAPQRWLRLDPQVTGVLR
jgi:hypothetical protein